MSWFVMEDGFSYGKVEDSYTDSTGKEHSEIGDVGELWLVVIPAELQLGVFGKQDHQEEEQAHVFRY